ncbi:MAG: histidine phosphatase family protein [Pseudomonadota bacterium]
MKLVLIRHGMTSWNLRKQVQGRIDQPLADEGCRQIEKLRLSDDLRGYRWYSSPLQRALQTIEILGVPDFRVEPRLIEMSWGDWEGQVLKPLRKQLGDEMRLNEARGLDFKPPGGESPREVQARLKDWLNEIVKHDQDCAVVAHKGVIRCFYSMAFNWDMVGDSPVDFAWDAAHYFEVSQNGDLEAYYEAVSLNATADD